jgi:multidrug efflux pump subunit AcrA (membrane-fusion protein)
MIIASALTSLGSYLPQSRRGRLLAAIGVTAALLAVLILVLRGASTRAHAPVAAAAAPAVTARALETMQLGRGVTANGTVHAWQEIVVGPEVGGYRVAAVNVEVGDRVRKGQELVRLADDLLAARQSRAGTGVARKCRVGLSSCAFAVRFRRRVAIGSRQAAQRRARSTRTSCGEQG